MYVQSLVTMERKIWIGISPVPCDFGGIAPYALHCAVIASLLTILNPGYFPERPLLSLQTFASGVNKRPDMRARRAGC